MENQEELLTEVLKRVQRNYMHMVEIERVTKELGDAMSRNDQESIQLLMKMRQEEMEGFGETKQEIRLLVEAAGEDKEKIISWLRGEDKHQPENFEAGKIKELSCQVLQVLNRTIDIDKIINLKVTGKDSYYQSAQ
jgi:hypothetical protein